MAKMPTLAQFGEVRRRLCTAVGRGECTRDEDGSGREALGDETTSE